MCENCSQRMELAHLTAKFSTGFCTYTKQVRRQTDRQTGRQRQTYIQTDRKISARVDGWMGGCMDDWMNGHMVTKERFIQPDGRISKDLRYELFFGINEIAKQVQSREISPGLICCLHALFPRSMEVAVLNLQIKSLRKQNKHLCLRTMATVCSPTECGARKEHVSWSFIFLLHVSIFFTS